MAKSGDLEAKHNTGSSQHVSDIRELGCLRTGISTSKKEINTKKYSRRPCEIVPEARCWLFSSPQAEEIKCLQDEYSDILFLLKEQLGVNIANVVIAEHTTPPWMYPRIASTAWRSLPALKRLIFSVTNMWSQNNHFHHFQISGSEHSFIHW